MYCCNLMRILKRKVFNFVVLNQWLYDRIGKCSDLERIITFVIRVTTNNNAVALL